MHDLSHPTAMWRKRRGNWRHPAFSGQDEDCREVGVKSILGTTSCKWSFLNLEIDTGPCRFTPILKLIFFAGLWVVLCGYALWQTMELTIVRGDLEHHRARQRMLYLAAEQSCVTREQLQAVALSQGWLTELRQSPYETSLLDDKLPAAILVYVEPPLPLGAVEWVAYQFDSAGCLGGN